MAKRIYFIYVRVLEMLPKNIFISIGFIMLQVAAIVLTTMILTIVVQMLRGCDFGSPPSPYILQNYFGHFADYHLDRIFAVPDRRAGIRLIVVCIFLEGAYWFGRRAFFMNEEGKLSIVKYMLLPTVFPLFITITFGDARSGGWIPLFSGIIVFFNHAFIWLITGLVIRSILCFFYGKLGRLPANIFAVMVLVISIALFM